MEVGSQIKDSVDSPINRFYRTVWRWHFYAGLFVIPFMLMLATTGIIYLFKPQLDGLMYRQQMFVKPAQIMLPYTRQLESALATFPGAKVNKITPSIAPDRSTEVELTTPSNRTLTVFVDPHTGKVLGDRDEVHNLQSYAEKLHGELMLGKVGDYLVEMAACWGLMLLFTGIYLWFPRKQFTVWGTLLPRLRDKSSRIFWRDIHSVAGFYASLLLGFLILTGLPWTGFWGDTFARVWNQFPAQMWDEIPKSTILTGSLNENGDRVIPWAVERLPIPQSTPASSHHHSLPDETQHSFTSAPVSLDALVALARSKDAPAGFSISFPKEATGVYTISAFPDDPSREITMHVDRYSGKVLAEVGWQDYSLVPKAVELGIAIHMGKYFGLSNQLLMLFACLSAIAICASGAIMWWKRRPEDRLGAPAMPNSHPTQWKVPMAIAAVLGFIFPLLGFSLVAVLSLDFFLLSRIPALKRFFN